MDKAQLDEMNFRYNNPEAHKPHEYIKETDSFGLPKLDYVPCRICGNSEDYRKHKHIIVRHLIDHL